MRVVDALDLLVPKLLLGMGARNSELGNAINDIDRYAEPINLVLMASSSGVLMFPFSL
jgi:hypothetical protein